MALKSLSGTPPHRNGSKVTPSKHDMHIISQHSEDYVCCVVVLGCVLRGRESGGDAVPRSLVACRLRKSTLIVVLQRHETENSKLPTDYS
jgi:hypothetical protein